MEDCAFCGAKLCPHAQLTIRTRTAIIECNECGQTGLIGFCAVPNYCLPTYEGRVDWTSNVYSSVCKACHSKYTEEEPADKPDGDQKPKQEQLQLFP